MKRTHRAALVVAILACTWAAGAEAQSLAATPPSFDFGGVAVGAKVSLTGTIANVGSAPVDVYGVAPCAGTSSEFSGRLMPTPPFQLYPGQTAQLYAFYAPVDATTDTGCLAIQSSDAVSPVLEIALSGSGVGEAIPHLALAPTSIGFGRVTLGTTATQAAAIQNTGAAELVVSAVALCAGTSDEYAYSAPALPIAIAPGASVELAVTYAPRDTVSDGGCVAITSNDPVSTARLSLAGVGLDPAAVLDADIVGIDVPSDYKRTKAGSPIAPAVGFSNASPLDGTVLVGLVAVQNGFEVYRAERQVYAYRGVTTYAHLAGFTPTAKGIITWTATVTDADPDVDTATADTLVR
jgi:hypothetical protein